MGWFDAQNKQQNVHVIASAWDMQRIEERNRKRRLFIILDVIAVIFLLVGIGLIYYEKNYFAGSICIIIGLLIFYFLFFRKKSREYKNFPRRNKHRRHRHRRFRR